MPTTIIGGPSEILSEHIHGQSQPQQSHGTLNENIELALVFFLPNNAAGQNGTVRSAGVRRSFWDGVENNVRDGCSIQANTSKLNSEEKS